MGITRAIVLASPLGEQGQVAFDLDPEPVGQSDGPDRFPSIVSMALARMGAVRIVPSSIQLDGGVTMTWHLETGH